MLPLDRSTIDRASSALPDWVGDARRDAYDIFSDLEPPSEREELWRHIDLDFELADFGLPSTNGVMSSTETPVGAVLPKSAGTAVVVDGTVVEASGTDVVVTSLADAITASPDQIRSLYLSTIPAAQDLFSAAHHAFSHDGVVIRAPQRSGAQAPVHVVVRSSADGAVTFPHVFIQAEDGAELSVIVEYVSDDDVHSLVAPQIEAVAGQASNLSLTIIQTWGYGTTAIAQSHVAVGRDSHVQLAEAGLGGAMSRLHLTVSLDGQGSSAGVVGAYFGEQEQTLDYRYFMRHVGLNTNSDMFLKGAVEDESLSVFTGMIRIDETAQGTNAFQTNRNLILSEGAAAQSVPNLEILANDVRCGHGSTVGPLNDEQRYYLMSRGLGRDRADRLQVHGFFEEALRKFPEQAVTAPVRDAIIAKYAAAQAEGRLR